MGQRAEEKERRREKRAGNGQKDSNVCASVYAFKCMRVSFDVKMFTNRASSLTNSSLNEYFELDTRSLLLASLTNYKIHLRLTPVSRVYIYIYIGEGKCYCDALRDTVFRTI